MSHCDTQCIAGYFPQMWDSSHTMYRIGTPYVAYTKMVFFSHVCETASKGDSRFNATLEIQKTTEIYISIKTAVPRFI